jgi:hypothetical protein
MGDLPMGDLPVVLVWPILTSALLGLAAPRLVRALPPARAVRLLVAGAVICAASTTLVLALTGWLLLAEIPVVAALGHWSAPQVDLRQPVPDVVEALAGVAWLVVIGRVSAAMVRFARSTLACRRTCAEFGGSRGDLVIIESARPEAYAVADGLTGGGRIVVSTGLLAALRPAERRVVFAHEAAHLHGRHNVWRALADVAVAANPLLTRVGEAVHYGTERWADEDTARKVGDRRLAARALARAALAASRSTPGPVMGLTGYGVSERIESLLGPPPPRRRLVTVLIGVLVAVTLAAAADADLDTDHFLDQAGRRAPSVPAPRTWPPGNTWHTFTPEWAAANGVSDEHLAKFSSERRSKVTFDIEDLGQMVKLTVVHDDFEPGSAVLEGIRGGWPRILSDLKTLLETDEPLVAG